MKVAYLSTTSKAIAKPAISVANFLFLCHTTFHPTTVPLTTSGDSTSAPPAKPEYFLQNIIELLI